DPAAADREEMAVYGEDDRNRTAAVKEGTAMTTAEDVLAFWFGRPGDAHYGEFRDIWFRGRNPAFDAEIRERFLPLHEDAAAGRLDAWRHAPRPCLALVIALD